MRNHAAQLAIIKQLSRQELNSTAGNCQADDRQESCSSAGNCQAEGGGHQEDGAEEVMDEWGLKDNPGFSGGKVEMEN